MKMTVMVHEAPAGMDRPMHWSSVSAKSSGSRPPCAIRLKNSGALPVLVILTVCGALLVPTA